MVERSEDSTGLLRESDVEGSMVNNNMKVQRGKTNILSLITLRVILRH